MLLAVIVPKRSVSETIATKHCYWNALIPVPAVFAGVIATERLLEHLQIHASSAMTAEIPQLGGGVLA